MVNPNPPLFVQDGEYPARLDRHLIGALLVPSAKDANQSLPRAGVRAQYVDATNTETSLRVDVSGLAVKILPGSAFVEGTPTDGIAALYLITNLSEIPLTIPDPIAGAEQKGMVGIKVSDPADMPTGGATEGKWEPIYLSTVPAVDPPPAAGFLHLADVTIPPTGPSQLPAPVDRRVYTVALGGTFQVASYDTLKASMPNAPRGSQAYSSAEDLMYVRAKKAWVAYPAVAQSTTLGSNNTVEGHSGELLWNVTNQTLAIRQGDKWIDIAPAPAVVRKGDETSWPVGPNERLITHGFNIYVPAGTAWLSIGNSKVKMWDLTYKGKPTENSLLMKVNLPAPRHMVTAVLYAEVEAFVKNAQGTFVRDTTNTFSMNIETYTSTGTAFDSEGRPVDDKGNAASYIQQYAIVDAKGITWTTSKAKEIIYAPMNNLSKGTNNIRVVFKAAKNGYFKVTNLGLQVNTAWVKKQVT